MIIIVVMPKHTGKYDDDTMQHCKALEKYCGHKIIRAFINKDNTVVIDKEYEPIIQAADLIWCPYEDILEHAFALKKALHKPIVGHFEIALPGRYLQDMVDCYWCEFEEPPTDMSFCGGFYDKYRKYINLYLQCDVKTITGQFHKFRCEKIIGKPLGTTYIKPYPLDSEMYDKYKKDDVEEKYQVCSIYRLVVYKKTKHIIKALSMLEHPPKYIIAGQGSCEAELRKYAEELGVDVEFRGHISDEEKVKLYQESMFSFSHYGWIPPTEAAYLKKPCISYYEPDTHERLQGVPYYVQANNIQALSEAIKKLSESKELREQVGNNAYNVLINNECHTHLLEEDSRLLTEILKKALQ